MHFSRHPSLLLVLGLLLVPGFAAEKKSKPAETLDAPPQLISTKGGGPKWKNVAELQQFAAKGDPQACFELGDRTLEGDGVPKEAAKAIPLFERAAQGGEANAWFKLGKIYHDGLTGTPDYGRALDYFTKAARLGVTEAQHNLGAMLVSARGVKRDYVEGLAWFIIANKSGAGSDAEAQVRTRLAKRPADITAAENRAKDISADLAHAEVRAVRPGAPPPPVSAPKVTAPAPASAPTVVQPTIAAPKIEPLKLDLPAPGKP